MENLFFIRFEILVLFVSFAYIVYFAACKAHKWYFNVKKVIKKEEISKVKSALNKVDLNTKENNYKKSKVTKQLTDDQINNLTEILKRAKINSTKWYFDTAKWLIIEWLSIDKFNKDLNLELANIYEKEKNFKNAEFIYNDLLDVYEKEPKPEIQLLMNPALSLTPHTGAATNEAQDRIGTELADQIISILK